MRKVILVLSFLLSFAICHKVRLAFSEILIQPYAPYWDGRSLYMVDFMNGTFIRFNPRSGRVHMAVLEGISAPAFLIQLKYNKTRFLIGSSLSAPIVEWDGYSEKASIVEETCSLDVSSTDEQIWDVAKASPKGTFFGGTFRSDICGDSLGYAGFYTCSHKCCFQEVDVPNLKSSGGFEWNAKGDKLYHISECDGRIREFDYNLQTGKISKGRTVFRYKGEYGLSTVPLGLTIDTNNCLYITIYGGGLVLVVNPTTSKVINIIHIPAKIVTAVVWGGKELDKLYVTTAAKQFNISTGSISDVEYPGSNGGVFVVTGLKARGFPGRLLKLTRTA